MPTSFSLNKKVKAACLSLNDDLHRKKNAESMMEDLVFSWQAVGFNYGCEYFKYLYTLEDLGCEVGLWKTHPCGKQDDVDLVL